MAMLHHWEDEGETFNREEIYERHLKEELWDIPLGAGGIGHEIAEERAEAATRKDELEWYKKHYRNLEQ